MNQENKTQHHFNDIVRNNIQNILTNLNIQFNQTKNRINVCCPFHRSSNEESLSYYLNSGAFICWTRHCEMSVGKFNNYRLIESFLNYKNIKKSAKQYIEEFSGQQVDFNQKKKEFDFVDLVKTINKKSEKSRKYITKNFYESLGPITYCYKKRGLSEKTIEYFNIRFCKNKTHEMYSRIMVPIYDENRDKILSVIGRSINEQCNFCGKYHYKYRMCPSTGMEKRLASKWINSSGFLNSNAIFNIRKGLDTVILVEGAFDAMKCYEAGIENACAIFGVNFSDRQFDILNNNGVTNIILAFDNDEAGQMATTNFIKKYNKYFNIKTAKFNSKDIGELDTQTIKETLCL